MASELKQRLHTLQAGCDYALNFARARSLYLRLSDPIQVDLLVCTVVVLEYFLELWRRKWAYITTESTRQLWLFQFLFFFCQKFALAALQMLAKDALDESTLQHSAPQPTDKAVDLLFLNVFHEEFNFITSVSSNIMAAGQYVVYGLEDNQELLRDVEYDQVRMAVITHARNQMFTSQFGRLTVVSCEQPKNESMSVYLRAAKKQLMQLQFYRSDTVGLLKRRVATVMGIPVSGIILVVKGKRLDDETVRLSSVVKQDQFLHVIDPATLCYENGRIYIEKTLASSTKSIYMSSQQTLQELFDRAERETRINSCCFKLYHLGGFLEASSNITLKEALLAEGCEIKLTVSQKKLMIVQMLIELLMLLVNSIELGEDACIEDLVEDEPFIQCVR